MQNFLMSGNVKFARPNLIKKHQTLISVIATTVIFLVLFSSIFQATLVSAQTVPNITSNIISHWTFDEGSGSVTTDSVGGNNGTVSGGTSWVAGKSGTALNFGSPNDYVSLPNMDVSGNEITIAAWIKIDSFPSGVDQRFVSKANGFFESNHWWMLGGTNSGGEKLRFRLKTGGNTSTLIASSGNLSAGVWTHVAAVYNGTTMRLYKDGIEVGSLAKSGSLSTNSAVPVNIGRNPDGYAFGYMDGSLDDVRIYNRALSVTDIAALANPSPDITPPTISITAPTNGTSVSGMVTVSANASDNIGVTGVQFKLNGANLNTEDTNAPFSTLWDTATVANGSYTLTAVARDAAGNQSTSSGITVNVSNNTTDTTPPSVPVNLVATAISPTQINLSWGASTDNVGVTGYNLYRCQGNGCTPTTLVTTVINTAHQDTGLIAETTYRYTVSAVDAVGNESTQSSIAEAITHNYVVIDPVPFTTIVIDASNSGDNKAVADFDLDGDDDGVVGGSSLIWYESNSGPTFTPHIIRSTPIFSEFTTDMQAADVDGDGDPDMIVGDGNGTNNLMWFENPIINPPAGLGTDPTIGTNWIFHTIGSHGSWVHEMEVGDINSDGKLDIVTSGNGVTRVWVQNSPTTWTNRNITGLAGGQGIYLGDIDRDNNLDIAVPGGWLETPDNIISGNWIRHDINGSNGEEVMLADFNNNGRLDLMSLTATHDRGTVTWFDAPIDPTVANWPAHVISTNDGAHHPEPIDFNNDGFVDILMGLELTAWNIYLNQGGAVPTFVAQQMDTLSGHNARAGDLDGDGDMDIFSSDWIGHPPVKVYINDTLTPEPSGLPIDQWTYKEVTSNHEQTFGLAFGDVNNDGNVDIISGGYWYRNPGADMTGLWSQFVLPTGMHAVLVTDVDGDAFADIIAQKTEGSLSFYWLEATNIAGTSWNSVMVGNVPTASHTLGAQGFQVADIIAGNRPEILTSSGDGIYYFEIPITSPESGNWNRVRINSSPSDEGFDVGDINGDGRLDVVATTGNLKTVQWYQNPGNGSANWTAFTLGSFPEADFPDRTVVADFNGDGRLDVAVSEENGTTLNAQTYWWAAPLNPTQNNWTRSLVTTQGTTNSMDSADMDQDGDPDLVLGEHRGTEKIAIWQNNGAGVFIETVVDTGKESHLGARTIDLDQDGDLDIVSIAFDEPQFLHLWRNDVFNSGGTPIDTIAPATVTNLTIASSTANSVTVLWTAPGDDGMSGVAVAYDLRYSTAPITEANWGNAISVIGEPTPSVSGTTESMIVSNLTPNTTYYLSLKTSDEASNISALSNIASTTTLEDPNMLIVELENLQIQYPSYANLIQGLIDQLQMI